jgi:hypothetical protein
MEKTNFNKTEGTFDETTKMANNWLADTCSVMSDIYDKQLKTTLGFYNNFFNSITETNKDGNNSTNFTSPFFKWNPFMNSMFKPFNSFKWDSSSVEFFTSQFAETQKQMNEFNTRLFALAQEELKNNQNNWNEFNKIVEEQRKNTQNIVNSLLEIYSKKLNQSIELNKKLAQEISAQFETVANKNKKNWSDLLKTTETNGSTEKENETERKEAQSKRQGKTELVNH